MDLKVVSCEKRHIEMRASTMRMQTRVLTHMPLTHTDAQA